jgi:CRP-like cAMP-binding protein
LAVEGKIPDSIYYLDEGTVIAYRLEGEEKKVVHKWIGPCVVADILNYVGETPSELYVKLVQESILLKIEKAAIKRVLSDYPDSAKVFVQLLSDEYEYTSIFIDIHTKDGLFF